MIVTAATGKNVLTKARLEDAMRMHKEIETRQLTAVEDGEDYDLLDLCTKAGESCVSGFEGI
jgi:hypothetical protein